MRLRGWVTLTLSLWGASLLARSDVLGVSHQQMTVGGRPAFLLGVSLFDALGATPPRDEDLDRLREWGVDIVRVWAHWSAPLYGRDGAVTAEGRSRLTALVTRLRARGLLLELVLLRPGQLQGQKFAVFSSDAARLHAVEELTRLVKTDRDVLFDLYNEHDHPDGPISHAGARTLRNAVKAIDPGRVVTISSTATHLITGEGRVGTREEQNLREEIAEVGVDLVAAHLPRTGDWDTATSPRIAALRGALERLGRPLPLYLDEENRSSPGALLSPEAYVQAYEAARQAGASGWVFHTPAGFSLGDTPFLDALTPNERTALARLKKSR